MYEMKPDQFSPFHEGERAVQERLGVRSIENWARKVVRSYLPDQHRTFYSNLPFVAVAARDSKGRPWATLLEGATGFTNSPDPNHLIIGAQPSIGDALEGALGPGSDIGILGIEFVTRRRNRINGRIRKNTDDGIEVVVEQTFGNCPQYIRERNWKRVDENIPGICKRGAKLSTAQQKRIEIADTFFIATGFRGDGESQAFGMDASHRGGEKGFVRLTNDGQLIFPDYAGNNHYNTIGNLMVDPKVGMLFVDFATGSMLQLTGKAIVEWNPDKIQQFPGAQRLVIVNIEEVVEVPSAISLRWEADADSVRSLRLVEKIQESRDVTSFVFEARDNGPLAGYEPGQHLPIEVTIPDKKEPVGRTYSLSSAPGDERYRITVKREPEGLISRYLHDNVEPGDIIESRRPAGDFMMTCNVCPLVLISAGVGVTPMVSILRSITSETSKRPVWFIHGARNSRYHPLAAEVTQIADMHKNVFTHIAYSQPEPGDALGKDYDSEGRISGPLIEKLVQSAEAHYFLCGPTGFMAEIQESLERSGVSAERIHFETFGPATQKAKE